MVEQLHTFSGGSVRHLERLVRADGAARLRTLPVRFGIIEHEGGPIVVDTGYHPTLASRLRGVARLYPRVVPYRCDPHEAVGARLLDLGYRADQVQLVILTHLHADHVAGLVDLPDAPLCMSRRAWSALQDGSRLDLARQGYFRELLPDALARRTTLVEPPAPVDDLDDSALDLLGDGSIGLVSLPGHAPGQIGVSVRGPQHQRALLVGDATFSRGALDLEQPTSLLFRSVVEHDPRASRQTLHRIRGWMRQHPHLHVLAAHAWEGPAEGPVFAPA